MTPTTPAIVKIPSTVNRGISAILYSDPGIGKTTTLSRLPVDETLIVNVEAGLGPLLGTGHNVFYLKDDLSEFINLFNYLKNEDHPFKYVCIDNISELQEWVVLNLTKMRKKDFAEIREKGDAASKLREILYNWRNLIDHGINVIFCAWEMPLMIKKDADNQRSRLFPKLYPSLSPEACGIVDLVGHLEMYEKTEDRFIRFQGNEDIMAKAQFRGLSKFEPADFSQIFAKIKKFNYAKAKSLKAVTDEEIKAIKQRTGEHREGEKSE